MIVAPAEAMMRIPDDGLLARCRAGDVEAFGQIYAEHQERVFLHAYHLLGHHDDACDVRQETFLRAYRSIASFRGDCALRTWLLRICTNLCRNQARNRQRRREVDLDPALVEAGRADETGDPAAVAERAQMASVIRAALNGLPAIHREVLVLRDIEELDTVAIAAILGCTRASVPVKLCRARQLLKSRVQRLTGEGE